MKTLIVFMNGSVLDEQYSFNNESILFEID